MVTRAGIGWYRQNQRPAYAYSYCTVRNGRSVSAVNILWRYGTVRHKMALLYTLYEYQYCTRPSLRGIGTVQ